MNNNIDNYKNDNHNKNPLNKNNVDKSNELIKNKTDIFWQWNDINNKKPIEMTVALPAINADKIIWLALESLKNQINITFAWELICLEEEGKSRSIIKKYVKQLPGCVRIVHGIIDPKKGKYNIDRYTLLEKWIDIANYADSNSKIFVKHACDCYSPAKRLYIHYEHFKNPNCYYSTQPKGYFYNIITKKYFLYNGYKDNRNIIGHIKDPKNRITTPHLNMALRTEDMRRITLPDEPLLAGIDKYIFITLLKNKPSDQKIIYTDDEIDPNNWKGSLDTDGYNNISLPRRKYYKKDVKKPDWIISVEYPTGLNVPLYILKKLNYLHK